MGPSYRRDDSVPSEHHIEYSPPSVIRSDFVQFHSNKSAVRLSNRQSIFPLSLVTILFFLWGFAYGLLDVLNKKLENLEHYSEAETTALHSAYFAGYFFAPLLFASWLLRHTGFRITFISGLCIYGVGCLVFWPCAVLRWYPGFVISNFIVGMGVATIEVAANLFIAITGPPAHWEARLNISQGVQAIGTVFSPILATDVFFKSLGTASVGLADVQWVYLGIGFFDFALALVFWYVPLPECTDEELDSVNLWQASPRDAEKSNRTIFSGKSCLIMGVIAQSFYVGAQEIIAVYGAPWIMYGLLEPIAPNHLLWTSEGLFAFGRLLGGVGMFFITPRYWYLFFTFGNVATSALLLGLPYPATTGKYTTGLLALRALSQFFESTLFPTIFVISIRGLSGHATKWGAAWMVVGTSGGAIWPPIYGAVVDRYGDQLMMGNEGYRWGWAIMVAMFGLGVGAHAVGVNVVPKWRHMLDDTTKDKRRVEAERLGRIGKRSGTPATSQVDSRDPETVRRSILSTIGILPD